MTDIWQKVNQDGKVWEPEYVDVLDHGYIGLVDFMGDDSGVVNAARCSYGKGTTATRNDEGLIRYLTRHWHTTPTEMVEFKFHVKAPIFVFRQWHRHRTACLAGNVPIHFDLPGGIDRRGNQKYTLTVKDIYERFQPTKSVVRPDRQRNPYYKRDRVQSMKLRSLDETTHEPMHTNIVDIWESGEKEIIKVTFENGSMLRASKDHLCFTDQGWLKLEDALAANAKFASISPSSGFISESVEPTDDEIWKVLPSNTNYQISDQGRVKSSRGVKLNTVTPQGYEVVSLSSKGVTYTRLVHHLVLETFCDESRDGRETLHGDHNRRNNRIDNLQWGSAKENAADRMATGTNQTLTRNWTEVVDSHSDGYEMTYDMEVSGPFHNFVAGGVVVHNSINEYSGRYSVMDNEMYLPHFDNTTPQSQSNKQGREDDLLLPEDYNAVRTAMDHAFETSYQTYAYLCGPDADGNQSAAPDQLQERRKTIEAAAMAAIQKTRMEQLSKPLDEQTSFTESDVEVIMRDWFMQSDAHVITDEYPGIARELARIVLPVSTYSQMYWKANLHNIMNFMRLRADSHAQHEIQVYADAMKNLITPYVPLSIKAFEDYRQYGTNLSRMETELLQSARNGGIDITNNDAITEFLTKRGCSAREVTEFITRY